VIGTPGSFRLSAADESAGQEGFGGKEAYYPVLEAFGQLIHGAGGDRVVQTLSAHAPTWLSQFPAAVKAEGRELLQREILGAIPYQANEALLHTDSSLMPRRPLAWAAWNYHLPIEQFARIPIGHGTGVTYAPFPELEKLSS